MESGDDDFPEKKREIIRNVSSLASFPAVRYWWNKAREHCQNSCKVETKTYFHYFLTARGYLECESVGPGFESSPPGVHFAREEKRNIPLFGIFCGRVSLLLLHSLFNRTPGLRVKPQFPPTETYLTLASEMEGLNTTLYVWSTSQP